MAKCRSKYEGLSCPKKAATVAEGDAVLVKAKVVRILSTGRMIVRFGTKNTCGQMIAISPGQISRASRKTGRKRK